MGTVAVDRSEGLLAELLERVAKGEEIELTRAGRPLARLVPARPADHEREVREAMERIERVRRMAVERGLRFDWEELKRCRDEGRR